MKFHRAINFFKPVVTVAPFRTAAVDVLAYGFNGYFLRFGLHFSQVSGNWETVVAAAHFFTHLLRYHQSLLDLVPAERELQRRWITEIARFDLFYVPVHVRADQRED